MMIRVVIEKEKIIDYNDWIDFRLFHCLKKYLQNTKETQNIGEKCQSAYYFI